MKNKVSVEQQKRYNDTERARRKKVLSETSEKGRDATRLKRLNPTEIAYLASLVPESNGDHCHDLPDHLLNEKSENHRARRLGAHARTPGFNQYTEFRIGAIVLASTGVFANFPLDEVSHLCGNWKCARADHLVWETHAQNLKRVGCPGEVNCGDHWCNACVHNPKCKKRTKIE